MFKRHKPGLSPYLPPKPVSWWRWALGTFLIVIAWVFGGSFLSLAILPYSGVDPKVLVGGGDIFSAMPGWGFLLIALVSFIPLFIAVMVAYRFVLGIRVSYLFSSLNRFRWWRVALGFFVWLGLIGGPVLAGLLFYPGQYQYNFSASSFIPFAVVGILLLPIQTSSEELLFRGWLLQWIGGRVRNIALLSIISGAAFALPHLLNPEAGGDIIGAFLGYFSVGFALAWVTIRDRSLEVALGAHLSNNLFAGLLFGYEGGVLPAEAIFVSGPVEWGVSNLLGILIIPVFILLTRAGRPVARSTENNSV